MGTLFWKSRSGLDTPDLQCLAVNAALLSPDIGPPDPTASCWSILPGVVRTLSKGQLRLSGPNLTDPIDIETNLLSDPADFKTAMRCVELSREIGNSDAFRGLRKREVLPGRLGKSEMESFVRNAIIPFWHFTCTAKMGRDDMSVVDGSLKVYGVSGLRIADGSVMPRVTTGNTMAPCIIIGERAAAKVRESHGLC
jgi:choline dehydrogenase